MATKKICEHSTDCPCIERRTNVAWEHRKEDEKDSLSAYLERTLFWLLVPALERTFTMASRWNALQIQKCRFNGLDHLAEILWNHNPQRSKTFSPSLKVFDIPAFKQWLREHPRPYYPKSWLWSEDDAALQLQRYIRGWLVRKRADVQEMRQFWKDIAAKPFFGEQMEYDMQQRKTYSGMWKDVEHAATDEDLDRCKNYREMFYTKYRKSKARTEDTL